MGKGVSKYQETLKISLVNTKRTEKNSIKLIPCIVIFSSHTYPCTRDLRDPLKQFLRYLKKGESNLAFI